MKKFTLVLTLITAFASNSAHSAMIDDFNGGNTVVVATDTDSQNYSHAFGGKRTINIEKAGPLGATSAVVAGMFAHSADALTSATSTISWNDPSSVDLVEGRSSSFFALDILTIDQGDIDLILSISDLLGGSDTYTLQGSGVGVQFIDFSLFSGIDFLQVTNISLQIVGDTASDITLDSISTVPTPSVLILLSMGLIALGFNRQATA